MNAELIERAKEILNSYGLLPHAWDDAADEAMGAALSDVLALTYADLYDLRVNVIPAMAASLAKAVTLCTICIDWNMEEVEIDVGSEDMVEVRDLRNEFRTAIAKATPAPHGNAR